MQSKGSFGGGSQRSAWGSVNQSKSNGIAPSQPQYKKTELSKIDIPGLIYIPNWITPQEEESISKTLDELNWSTELHRRVIQYGYRFDHLSQHLDVWADTPKIPPFLQPIAERLYNDGHFKSMPEQMIINEYLPGQGINPHTDRPNCFGDVVASISLFSPALMEFRNSKTFEKKALLLEPRSLLLMSGEARYHWTHGISKSDVDEWKGKLIKRTRRVSLTYRTILQEYVNERKKLSPESLNNKSLANYTESY